MALYDWANGGSVDAFFWHGIVVSGLCQCYSREWVWNSRKKIVLGGCREGYCEYGSATGILCWVYDVLGELYPIHLGGLMGSKSDSRTSDQ